MRNSIVFITSVCVGLITQKGIAQSVTRLDPGSQIEGTYKVSQMTIFNSGEAPKVINYKPGDQISTLITAKRKSERYVILTLSQSQDTTQIFSFRYGEAYLSSTSKGYDLAINGNKVGETDGRNLTIDISVKDKERGAIKRSLIVCKKS